MSIFEIILLSYSIPGTEQTSASLSYWFNEKIWAYGEIHWTLKSVILEYLIYSVYIISDCFSQYWFIQFVTNSFSNWMVKNFEFELLLYAKPINH